MIKNLKVVLLLFMADCFAPSFWSLSNKERVERIGQIYGLQQNLPNEIRLEQGILISPIILHILIRYLSSKLAKQ